MPAFLMPAVYDQNTMKVIGLKYDIRIRPDSYFYSVIAAYIVSPFTLLPYEIKKGI